MRNIFLNQLFNSNWVNGHCPVWGNIPVEKEMLVTCSAPIGAGGSYVNAPFYRYSAPDGAGAIALVEVL